MAGRCCSTLTFAISSQGNVVMATRPGYVGSVFLHANDQLVRANGESLRDLSEVELEERIGAVHAALVQNKWQSLEFAVDTTVDEGACQCTACCACRWCLGADGGLHGCDCRMLCRRQGVSQSRRAGIPHRRLRLGVRHRSGATSRGASLACLLRRLC